MKVISIWLNSFLSLLFPRCCIVCNERISHAEEYICTRCNFRMPRTNYHRKAGNMLEKMCWGQMPIERATALFYYQKDSNYRHIIHELKYKGRKEVGEAMGRNMAYELENSHFFDGIDVIMPIPIHSKRFKKRGYNQSEWIAKGISAATNIPIDAHSVVRSTYTKTQVGLSTYQRWENVRGAFTLQHPEKFKNKHILIVDDVFTTGSTTIACADAYAQVEGVRISIIALGVASRL